MLLASATLCIIALAHTFGGGSAEDLPAELLGTLAAVALGPIGFNRWWGERKMGEEG